MKFFIIYFICIFPISQQLGLSFLKIKTDVTLYENGNFGGMLNKKKLTFI